MIVFRCGCGFDIWVSNVRFVYGESCSKIGVITRRFWFCGLIFII